MEKTDLDKILQELGSLDTKIVTHLTLSLNDKLNVDKLSIKIDELTKKVDDVNAKITLIEKPDEGLYSRVRDLENWKQSVVKIVTLMGTVVAGIATKLLYDLFSK